MTSTTTPAPVGAMNEEGAAPGDEAAPGQSNDSRDSSPSDAEQQGCEPGEHDGVATDAGISASAVDWLDTPVSVTTFPPREMAKGKRRRVLWRSLADGFTNPRVAAKEKNDLPGWAPATFRGEHRKLPNVESVHAVVVDVDNKTVESPTTIEGALNATLELAAIVHTSWSHKPAEPRFRVVYPVSRAMTPAEYPLVWRWLHQRYVQAGLSIDESTKDASRYWYWPCRRNNYWSGMRQGHPIDVDAVLGEEPPEAEEVTTEGDENDSEPTGTRAPSPGISSGVPDAPGRADSGSDDRVERARRYARKCRGAVSGSGGHKTTFSLACVLVRGFDLADADALRILQDEYNPKCQPPWSDQELRHKVEEARTKGTTPPIGHMLRRRPIGVTTEERRVADQVVESLRGDSSLYQRGYRLVRIVRDPGTGENGTGRPSGTPVISPVSTATLREHIADVVEFYTTKATKQGTVRSAAHPPTWVVDAVHARGTWEGIRPLAGVVEAPVLRPNGSVLNTPGYDRATGLVFLPNADFGTIPDAPTLDDARAAVADLHEVVCDVPFESEIHRSTWIAGVLTYHARYAYDGPSPMFVVDANVRGSGKNLVVDCASMINTGRPMPRMAHRSDDDEVEKQVTAAMLAGTQLLLIDNVRGALGGKTWEAATTATEWQGRRLGQSELVSGPLLLTLWATANNVELSGDMARRVGHIRLQTEEERPEDRPPEKYRHPALLAWVRQNRPRLVRAALTILRAYAVAGFPKQAGVRWGSFEGWASVVAGALVWCGQPDPCRSREALETAATSDASKLGVLIETWRHTFGDTPRKVAEVLRVLTDEDARVEVARRKGEEAEHGFLNLRDAITEICPGRDGRLPSPTALGRKLGHLRGRVVDGRCLDHVLDRTGTARWRTRQVGEGAGDAGDAGDVSSNAEEKNELFGDTSPVAPRRDRKLVVVDGGGSTPASPASPAASGSVAGTTVIDPYEIDDISERCAALGLDV